MGNHATPEEVQRWTDGYSDVHADKAQEEWKRPVATKDEAPATHGGESKAHADSEAKSVWPETWQEVEAACRKAGESYGKPFGCLLCSRCFGDDGSLFAHISSKANHATPEEIQR